MTATDISSALVTILRATMQLKRSLRTDHMMARGPANDELGHDIACAKDDDVADDNRFWRGYRLGPFGDEELERKAAIIGHKIVTLLTQFPTNGIVDLASELPKNV